MRRAHLLELRDVASARERHLREASARARGVAKAPLVTLLARRLGPERAAVVIEAAGGQRLAIPATLEENAAPRSLERLLGRELAVALVLHFGGSTVYVPNRALAGGARRVKLSSVVRMTRNGRSARYIAGRLGCSERTVYARRAEAKELGLLEERL